MDQEPATSFEASDVIAMFPTLVWKLQLNPAARDSIETEVLALLETLRRGKPPLLAGEGWQSEQNLHRRQEMRDLTAHFDQAARGILRFWHIGYDAFEITGCWLNVLVKGAAHRLHAHPNNFLSGVYYVRTHPGANTINFHDPRVQTGIIRPPVTELTNENTDQVAVSVSDGTLLLFPAYVQHSVDPSASDRERISVSFNVMFSSFTENMSKPLW